MTSSNNFPTPYDIKDKRKKIYYRILFYMLSKFDYLEEFKIRFEERQIMSSKKNNKKSIGSLKELFDTEDILEVFSKTNWRRDNGYDDFTYFAIFTTYLMLFLKISFKDETLDTYNHIRNNLEKVFDAITTAMLPHHDLIGYIDFLSKNKEGIEEIVRLT